MAISIKSSDSTPQAAAISPNHLQRHFRTLKHQIFWIPPSCARIGPPRTSISRAKHMVHNIRHKERYGRKIMHTSLEASIRRPKNKRSNTILHKSSAPNPTIRSACLRKRTRQNKHFTLSVSINTFSSRRYASLNCPSSYRSSAFSASIFSRKCLVSGPAKSSTNLHISPPSKSRTPHVLTYSWNRSKPGVNTRSCSILAAMRPGTHVMCPRAGKNSASSASWWCIDSH